MSGEEQFLVPEELGSALVSAGIEFVRLLDANPGKGRVVLLGRLGGELCVVKWNDSAGRFGAYAQLLDNEGLVYRVLGPAGISPELLSLDFPVCSRYLGDAVTMREYCLAAGGSDDALEALTLVVLCKWAYLVELLSRGAVDNQTGIDAAYGQLVRYMTSLACSGPMGTTARKASHLVSKCLLQLFLMTRGRRLHAWLGACSTVRICAIHGDFHLNNILIDASGEVRFIDFENVGAGVPEIELAYFFAQEWALTSGRFSEGRFMDALERAGLLRSGLVHERLLGVCLIFMKASVSLNNRFARPDAPLPNGAWKAAFTESLHLVLG